MPSAPAATGQFETGFALDHPTAAGHFPGNPIIPGALLLDLALRAMGVDQSRYPCRIRSVKFLHPVRPGDRLRIEWRDDAQTTQFGCVLSASGTVAMSGTLSRSDRTP